MIAKKINLSKVFFLVNLLFIFLVFAAGFRSRAFGYPDSRLFDLQGETVTISASVCREADIGISNRRLTVCAPDKILVTTGLYPDYQYGDFLEISGRLQAPPRLEDFDYADYLARHGIYAVMYYPKIELRSGRLNFLEKIFSGALAVKGRVKNVIDSGLPEPEAGLANALLLGYRRTVSAENSDYFSRIGLSHMIAISGSHMTIMSAMMMSVGLFLGLSRRAAVKAVYIFLIVYPFLTGLAASALRSSIMGILAVMATNSGRLSSLPRALAFSAALMLAGNPRLLRDDLGFQLSFAALLGIVYLYPGLEKVITRGVNSLSFRPVIKRVIKALGDLVAITTVAQLAVLPITLINFHQLSLIAPIANLLILWVFPWLLGSLLIAVLSSLAWPAAAPLFFFPAYLLLEYVFRLTFVLSRPKWAAVSVDWFTWLHGTIYYLLLIVVVYFFQTKTPSKKRRGF